jgi:hypothetical protein
MRGILALRTKESSKRRAAALPVAAPTALPGGLITSKLMPVP